MRIEHEKVRAYLCLSEMKLTDRCSCLVASHVHGPQVLLQSRREDFIDEGDRLPVPPEYVLPAPKGSFMPKSPATKWHHLISRAQKAQNI